MRPPSLCLGLPVLFAALAFAEGDGETKRQEPASPVGLTLPSQIERDAVREAIDRALAFLAAQHDLEPDGSFPAGQKETYSPVGVTALGALAFLSTGNQVGRGPYAQEVEQAIDYLLSRVAPKGDERAGYISDEADHHSRMHGHGLATLALAQAYGLSPRTPRGRRIAAALTAAVDCIERTQTVDGGWYYEPVRQSEHEGSITVCLLQALRAAKEAGIEVDTKVIARAIDYVKRLQNKDGGFRYTLDLDRPSVALTGACLGTLHAAGTYEGTVVDEGYAYIWRELAVRDVARERGQGGDLAKFPYYERFYLGQALWQHPDAEVYPRWADKERPRVLVTQERDGSWKSTAYGSSYATAMNVLFLALPEGLLPIFQR